MKGSAKDNLLCSPKKALGLYADEKRSVNKSRQYVLVRRLKAQLRSFSRSLNHEAIMHMDI